VLRDEILPGAGRRLDFEAVLIVVGIGQGQGIAGARDEMHGHGEASSTKILPCPRKLSEIFFLRNRKVWEDLQSLGQHPLIPSLGGFKTWIFILCVIVWGY